MGVQSSSSSLHQTPQHSLSQSHSSAIHFPHQPSNPLLTSYSSSAQFQLNSQSLSILAKEQIVQSNYEEQFDPLFTNFRPQSKLIYGKVRILCSKITNQKVQQYRVVFRNQQQMKVYLMSYYWRKAVGINDAEFPLVRTVHFKVLQESKNVLRGGLDGLFAKTCSNRKQILCRIYTQDIPLRLCHIKDIPFPENLYVLRQSLRGFQIIYQNIGYIHPQQDLICIGRKGQVKVWINSDLSKNFPNVQNMQSNFTQINSQSKLINEIIQLVNTNTDSQGQPCSIAMYMKRCHVNMEYITFEKVFEMLARYSLEFSIEIPHLFASIVQALNEDEQEYDTYRTQKEFQEKRESEGNGDGSGDVSVASGSKGKMRRESNLNSNSNSQQRGNLLNINSSNHNIKNANSSSNRNLLHIKKRPTHVKSKTHSLYDNPREQGSQQSSLIHNERVKSNILLSYSVPISSSMDSQLSHDDAVVEESREKLGDGMRIEDGGGGGSVRHSQQGQFDYHYPNSNATPQSRSNRQPPSHNFLSTMQFPQPPNEVNEFTRNKKTYSNFWQRSNLPVTTLMPQQPSSSLTSQQHNPTYIKTSKQQYEEMLRIDRYIQAEVLEEEYQEDKARSMGQSQCGKWNQGQGYTHQRVYSNNCHTLHISSHHNRQQQKSQYKIITVNKRIISHGQLSSHHQQPSAQQPHSQQRDNLKRSEGNMPNSNYSRLSSSLSALPDLQEQSNRKVVVVKESVSINETSRKDVMAGNNGDMEKVAREGEGARAGGCYGVPQLHSPFKDSSHDSYLPSPVKVEISNQSLASNNHLSPQNITSNHNNLSNNLPSQQVTSHQTQSQFMVSNTSLGHSAQGGVYQNPIVIHHPMNNSVNQSASGHSYQALDRNHRPFQLQSFKSAEFGSYNGTFGNNNKLCSPNSLIIPKITFTIHSPEVYSTSSQHRTTSLQQSLMQVNDLQHSQQYYQPQDPINLEPNLTVSNANCKPTQQPNFKRLAHRANTVKSHYMNSQGNQISSSRKNNELGQNQSLQSKPSIVEYSLLRNPEMFKVKKQQQNMLIQQTLQETNSFQKLALDKTATQQNRMDLMKEFQQEYSEGKVFGSEEMQQQQQSNGGRQDIQENDAHSYPHNQSEPQLRHLYYQKGSQMVPIPEDVMAETINYSRSLLMMNNCEDSITLKTIRGQRNSSHDSNNSQILKSINQHNLSDFGNEVLLNSYEYQPQQQLAKSYHKKLQQLDDQRTQKQQQHSYNENNNVNFNLNANVYTDENVIMDNQISKIEQRKSHEVNLNGMHISKPSFQSIQSSQIHFKQGFSSKQLSPNDRKQNSSKLSQKQPHYLKLIATKSISGSRVEEQGQKSRSKFKFAESIEQNSANSVYQYVINDDIIEKSVGIEVSQFMKEHSPSEQKDISSASEKLSQHHPPINQIPGKTILPNNENQFNIQFVDHESSISSQMDYAYKSYEKLKELTHKKSQGHQQQGNQQQNIFLKRPLNQFNQRHKNYRQLVKSSIQGMNLTANYYFNNTQQRRQANILKSTQGYCNEFDVSFQKNHSHSNFIRVTNQYKEDEIDEQILNDLKNL